MDLFDRPIPGQSLTAPPRNAPYERPPEVVDPEQALQIHLDRLTNPDRMEDAMFFLEMGVDLVTLVEGILRSAVMEGVHSIDVSFIIAPVIHEYIKSTADLLEVPYNEGFEDKAAKKQKTYARNITLARKKMGDMGVEPKNVARQMTEASVEMPAEEEMPEMMREEQPVGLMARRA
jgi:hypothetical protein